MKILFMGTPDFAEKSLRAICEANYDVLGVVTNQDKPKGRGMKMVASPVKEYAISQNLNVYQPEKVRNNVEFLDEVKKLNPDLICVVAYGKILPKEILDIPKFGCINVHASLLPKYRGAAPIQWAVLNGDKETGVTTMYMDVGMDTGDIILSEKVKIGEDETTGELWDRLSKVGTNLLIETIKQIESGTAPRIKQAENFTMAPMLEKEIARIKWEEKTMCQIKDLVRGLNPIMGAYTFLNEKKIKFWKVQTMNDEELTHLFPEFTEYFYKVKDIIPGTVILSDSKKGLFVKAIDGIVEVKEIQGENAKRMNISDYLRGTPINVGDIFN